MTSLTVNHKKMGSQVYSGISLKRSDQVKTLLNLKNGVKIEGDTVHVDPTILFSRLLIQVERSEDMKAYFSYELTQIPSSLFKDRMRKANKALLTAILTKEVTSVEDTPGCAYVHDGGALLHHVCWKAGSTYGDIVCQYSSYINQKYGFALLSLMDIIMVLQ